MRRKIPDGVSVRAGRIDDVPALTEIYNHYVTRTCASFDIEAAGEEERRAWFGHYAGSGPHRLLVAELDGRPAGYATSSAHRTRAAYRTSADVSVYLRPDAVGQGIGTRLYDVLLPIIDAEGVHRAYAGVTLPNDASVALHRRFGFLPVGVFSEVGYKFGRYHDVAWFERRNPR